MSMEIVQIVPRLPPSISGVGDYAYSLASQLRATHGIHSRFVVCDPTWLGPKDFDGFSIDQLNTQQAGELESRISALGMPATVVLHYVGYGYQKRGCPFWVVRGLESWKTRSANR